jgi:ABC-type dipeptide/oligopeptide/nickel transport system ATPase subunit
MFKIKELRIKNFKAFQEEQVFNFTKQGKNLLVYGNNGSGKSSLFWALYTLFQSSTKEDVDVEKYFENYLESNTATHQSLKNIFMEEAEDAFIKLIAINTKTELEQTFTISKNTINTNNDDNTLIQELNITSDFINYKLLHNFYNGSHKTAVNIWPVFERDIFPLLTDGTQNWLEDIIKFQTKDVDRTPSGNVVSQNKKTRNIEKLDTLNEKIVGLLSQIETNANSFIKDHFFNKKDVIKVEMKFVKKFTFDKVRNKLWDADNTSERHKQISIKLIVYVFDENVDGNWRKIERVQSFLNEAQLTRIAIGIRIGALRTRPLAAAKFKTLVLDDMLISLDMSNRMDIVRIILNTENNEELEKIFGGFQKIIMTHDLGFYELLRRNTNPDEWDYMKFHSSEKLEESPNVKIDKCRIEKAKSFLVDGEYDACGNELRKETEAVLDKYLKGLNKAANDGTFEPLMSKLTKALNDITENNRKAFNQVMSKRGLDNETIEKLKTDFEHDTSLTQAQIGKLKGLRNTYVSFILNNDEQNNKKEELITEIKDILRRVMNPASHAGSAPLFRGELQKAIDGVIELKGYLNQP